MGLRAADNGLQKTTGIFHGPESVVARMSS